MHERSGEDIGRLRRRAPARDLRALARGRVAGGDLLRAHRRAGRPVVIRLIAAELFKLRTTRAFYALAGGALGFTLLIIALGAIFDSEATCVLGDVMMIAFFAQLIVLVIGILCITNEFRHGTITPTLLVSPEPRPARAGQGRREPADRARARPAGVRRSSPPSSPSPAATTDDALAADRRRRDPRGPVRRARRRARRDRPQPGRRDHRRARLPPAARGPDRARPRDRRRAAEVRPRRDVAGAARDRRRRPGAPISWRSSRAGCCSPPTSRCS